MSAPTTKHLAPNDEFSVSFEEMEVGRGGGIGRRFANIYKMDLPTIHIIAWLIESCQKANLTTSGKFVLPTPIKTIVYGPTNFTLSFSVLGFLRMVFGS